MFSIIKKLISLPTRTALDSWDDIDLLTGNTGQIGLMRFGLQFINSLPANTAANKPAITEGIELLGQALTKHIQNSNTYTRYMTMMRKELISRYGQEILPVMIAAKISDSDRTKAKNAVQIVRRNKRHEESFNISISDIMGIIGKMVDDINSGDRRFVNTIVLLFELCTGARIGEVMSFGKFTVTGPNEITQEGVLKRGPRAGQVEKLKIPTLYDAKYLVDHLNAWRALKGFTAGTYDLDEAGKLQSKINILLRKRYLSTESAEYNTGIKTHLLRAIYANAAYKLAGGEHETLSGFISRILGHTGLETGLSYSFVKITEDDPAE
jgi:hypothetical protein